MPNNTALFEVNQLGAGFLAIGNWYWCHVAEDGLPTEAIDTHGPYPLRILAEAAARRATG